MDLNAGQIERRRRDILRQNLIDDAEGGEPGRSQAIAFARETWSNVSCAQRRHGWELRLSVYTTGS